MPNYQSTRQGTKQIADVNYLSKDFDSIKSDLIDYLRRYFPDDYQDFNEASGGMAILELLAYIGDAMSFYIDRQVNEGFIERKADTCIIPPNSFVLARTVEYFRIPRDILVVCLGKSTYARCGIIVNVTPLEPGWEGYVTLEFSNTTPLPAKIYANEGVAQFIFLKGNEKPEVTYADRNGKYMGQTGVTLPKV